MRLTAEEIVPLQSLEAEMCTLGSMILKSTAAEAAFQVVKDDHFYLPAHREIFRAMRQLSDNHKPIDLITLKHELVERGTLIDVGGEDYLIQLAEAVPSASNVTHYAGIVREKATLRALDSAGHEIIKVTREPEMDVDQKLNKAENIVFQVGNDRLGKDFTVLRSLAKDFMIDMDALVETNEPVLGVASDFYDLDKMTTGFYGGDFIIVAARPSMGKTSFVMKIALNVARQNTGAVAVFSLEMSGKQLTRRVASMLSGVGSQVLKRADLNPNYYTRLSEACEVMYDLPIYIDESSDITPLQMKGKCRRLKQQDGLALVVVDYIQLMQLGDRRSENRVQEISSIARALKGMAKELDVPVIALSQLSRGVENRDNKRPQLSDLRDSGSIEAEADIVMMIYREDYYKQRENPDEVDTDPERVEVAEILIQKHRNGPTGTVKLGFQPTYANFLNLKL
jgi:replicative DNA helicase